jgi:type IV secretion system protein VirB1
VIPIALSAQIALVTQIARTCDPAVAPGTQVAVAAAESGFDPLAIRDNTAHMVWRPRDRRKAVWLAEELLGAGHRLDLGLMQIDSANLARLHLTVAQSFEPCAAMHAAGRLLIADYKPVGAGGGVTPALAQRALRAALSRYNTGDPVRGFQNGYVARVEAAARYVVPEIAVLHATPAPTRPPPQTSAAPDWQVFGPASGATPSSSSWNVFSQSAGGPLNANPFARPARWPSEMSFNTPRAEVP